MESAERVFAGLEELNERTERPSLEPDPGRGREEFDKHREAIDEVVALLEDELLAIAPEAAADLEIEELGEALKNRVGEEVGDVAALLLAAGDDVEAMKLLRKGLTLVPTGPVGELLAAAQAEPQQFVQLVHGRWLVRNGEFQAGDALLGRVVRNASREAIKDAARTAADGPRPVAKAPTLMTYNGIGTGLYGKRDYEDEYGSYVSTLCFCVLYVPLIPIQAYRVVNHGDRSYSFLAKEKLSSFARTSRMLTVAAVVLAIVWAVASSMLNAPDRLARVALEDLEAEQLSGDALVEGYGDWFDRHGYEAAEPERSRAMGALAAALVDTAGTPDLERTQALLALPGELRSLTDATPSPEAREAFAAGALRWIDGLGTSTEASIRASLQIAEAFEPMDPQGSGELRQRRRGLHRKLAESLASYWPIEALENYIAAGLTDDVVVAAGKHIETFGDGPSLYLLAGDEVERWIGSAKRVGEAADLAERIQTRLTAARKAVKDPERLAALKSLDEAALEAALRKVPGDQEVAVALAEVMRGAGKAEAARALLEGLGPQGRMTPSAKRVLAEVYADLGKLMAAEGILERWLTRALPEFKSVRHAYDARFEEVRDATIARLERGDARTESERRLLRAPEAEQAELIGQVLSDAMDRDAELERLRGAYAEMDSVVPAALTLGMIKLRRANESDGDARQALLDSAEDVFLGIRQDAEGLPTYHLGLGQVYYRLGKVDEGEREFQELLDKKDDQLSLAVARTYRELGHPERAREIGMAIWESSANAEIKEGAATLMAATSTDKAEEKEWLQKAGSSSAFVKASLMRVEAEELLGQGELEKADAKFAEVEAAYLANGKDDPVSGNNAALVMQSRYFCTGDAKHLQRAVQTMEEAFRLAPDNALLALNYASVAHFAAMVRVLSRWIDPALLELQPDEVKMVVVSLAQGPERAKLRKALVREPLFKRAGEIMRQAEVLAPTRPDPYEEQLGIYSLVRDTLRLEGLARRVQRAELNLGDRAAQRELMHAGIADEDMKLALVAQTGHFEGRAQAAEKSRDKRSKAVALLMAGAQTMRLAWLAGDEAAATRAVRHLQESVEAWPGAGAPVVLSQALLLEATLAARKHHDGLAKRWEAERRAFEFDLTLRHALLEDGDGVRAALKKHPSFAKAVATRAEHHSSEPGLGAWLFAQDTGDPRLIEAAGDIADRADLVAFYSAKARLNPGSKDSQERLALVSQAP